MKTTPENQKLMDLITDARKGELVLPQFQRNFVWSRDDITSLLVSILQGHFIGTFLFLETDKDKIPFSVRAIEGIDNVLTADLQQNVIAVLAVMPPYEHFIVVRHMGLMNNERNTLLEIAKLTGFSREQIRTRERKAINRYKGKFLTALK